MADFCEHCYERMDWLLNKDYAAGNLLVIFFFFFFFLVLLA
jgi:hypothetical protein